MALYARGMPRSCSKTALVVSVLAALQHSAAAERLRQPVVLHKKVPHSVLLAEEARLKREHLAEETQKAEEAKKVEAAAAAKAQAAKAEAARKAEAAAEAERKVEAAKKEANHKVEAVRPAEGGKQSEGATMLISTKNNLATGAGMASSVAALATGEALAAYRATETRSNNASDAGVSPGGTAGLAREQSMAVDATSTDADNVLQNSELERDLLQTQLIANGESLRLIKSLADVVNRMRAEVAALENHEKLCRKRVRDLQNQELQRADAARLANTVQVIR